jgi:hypothetical protein
MHERAHCETLCFSPFAKNAPKYSLKKRQHAFFLKSLYQPAKCCVFSSLHRSSFVFLNVLLLQSQTNYMSTPALFTACIFGDPPAKQSSKRLRTVSPFWRIEFMYASIYLVLEPLPGSRV